MDSTTEKSCLEEISVLVFDALEKVTLKTISNNWTITNDAAKEVLTKWIEMNSKKLKELSKEFLIRGYNSKGVFSFSIVSEDKQDVLEKKWKNFGSWLYSIEMSSNSRKLNLPDYEPIKVKNILLKPSEPRNLHIPYIPVAAPVKEEPISNKKTVKTPFNVIKPAAKPEAKKVEAKKVEVKNEVVVKSPEEATPVKVEAVKSEKTSPEEGKANSKAPVGKKATLKNQKPVQKGAISSFFSNKPGPSKAATEKPKAVEEKPKAVEEKPKAVEEKPKAAKEKPKEVKEKPKVEAMLIDDDDSEEEVKAPKRKSTPEKPVAKKQEPSKKKATKKIKLKDVPTKKRSRIIENRDSSDEEEEEKNDSDEPETKFIKFDREFTPDRESSPAPKESPKKEPEVGKSKRKAKRMVKKRFQGEDGFITTQNILEEYSVSEDEVENDENKKKNSPAKEKAVKVEKKEVEKKSTEKKSAEKKKQPAAKPTQASKITSFFTKK